MIGFKKTPTKLVISVFLISIILIVLAYIDLDSHSPAPIEEITISQNIEKELPAIKNKIMHKVKKGESLSVIFEEKRVPLNTAYKIFNFDKNNILSGIRPDDIMEFNYIGEELDSIEIIKDEINSILIEVSDSVSVRAVSYTHLTLPTKA